MRTRKIVVRRIATIILIASKFFIWLTPLSPVENGNRTENSSFEMLGGMVEGCGELEVCTGCDIVDVCDSENAVVTLDIAANVVLA